jgi:hypothetical protein
MDLGLVFGLAVLAVLAAWGIWLAVQRVRERPTETSSHHESGVGQTGSHGGGSGSGSD